MNGGLGLVPLAVLGALPTDRPEEESLRELVLKIEARLRAETSHAQAVKLMTATFILTGLRIKRTSLAQIYRGVGIMRESSAYQFILEEGIEKGIEQGIEQGIEKGIEKGMKRGIKKGMKKGELQQAQKAILRLGTLRFGSPDAAIVATLNSIADMERLDRLTDAVLTAKNWQKLLASE